MPESVEAAREAAWHEYTRDYSRWALTGVGQPLEFDSAWNARGEFERNRLLNPSPELVEAVAKAILVRQAMYARPEFHLDKHPEDVWRFAGEPRRTEAYNEARAALQAAAKEI